MKCLLLYRCTDDAESAGTPQGSPRSVTLGRDYYSVTASDKESGSSSDDDGQEVEVTKPYDKKAIHKRK
jgi:hypothetical protein